ncbi:hypothetical protein COW36_09655 [bacterium (Candidatus Blackallbacteria) CG17_big_fil_post_rev_8_21_14_2_50_48_46]|uniref:Uncharacterized protein n=1 Tax=bacterium (Candidatus Blackallbacteria) CG17_big_fil_post_rev_8_21_14_2_50_48_46 TaxID=2014261 RepID=A0A2M7G5L6_9BACT|nr:MAG: hypothetical protein COW36_09655 [bacterium (Candidatus Blackallbacteria) CG17_big_fil_post_rev_8_21_14_2_50_48_46]PIW51017.1 MAG: hypothetical protein COW20_00665 [bacterium (Candidatus Blackallbacteria) CG13_big_fil_rev_8_21_14_2_50_49_14]
MSKKVQVVKLASPERRSLEILKDKAWKRGLPPYRLISILSALGLLSGLVPLVISADKTASLPLIGGGVLLFSVFSIYFYQLAKQLEASRLKAMLSGELVQAKILSRGTQFNPFSSTPHTTLQVWVDSPSPQELTGILWRRDALRDFQPGKILYVLWLSEENRFWLPFEAGIEIQPED